MIELTQGIMITTADIKKRIEEMCTHFTFEYNGKRCGIDPVYIPKTGDTFEMWCGDEEYTAYSIDDVMNKPFFDGKPLKGIVDEIEIDEW